MDVVVHVYNRYLEKTVQTINVTKIIVKPVWILLSCHPELLYNPYHRKKNRHFMFMKNILDVSNMIYLVYDFESQEN